MFVVWLFMSNFKFAIWYRYCDFAFTNFCKWWGGIINQNLYNKPSICRFCLHSYPLNMYCLFIVFLIYLY